MLQPIIHLKEGVIIMAGILGINTSEIPPRTAAPAGIYNLRIAFMKTRDNEGNLRMSKKTEGRQLVLLGFNVVGDSSIELITSHLMSNVEDDDAEFVESNQQTTADFMNCFGLDHELELDEVAETASGKEGRAYVGVVEKGDFAGNNEIKRFIIEN